ncbi:hypothetical protein HanPSC8_Chr01g0023431 [Helianthus annuus]|nr:hypothetical protein HanPSC8_Chr01g0023431 [Helianthus annuus]
MPSNNHSIFLLLVPVFSNKPSMYDYAFHFFKPFSRSLIVYMHSHFVLEIPG